MTETPRRPALARRAIAVGAVLSMLLVGSAAAAGSSTTVSGSVFVDYWWLDSKTAMKRASTATSATIDGALKIGVDVNDDVAFSSKACISCHGVELESLQVDYMPRTWFNVQAGRISVPFGDYHARVDQSGHKTVSAPLIYDMGRMVYGEKAAFNLGVLPMPYVDNGVLVYGQKFLGPVQAWYGVYGTGGLRGSNDIEWTSMRALYYTDSNRLPAGGGRLSFTYAAGTEGLLKDSTVGFSFTAGRYDRDAVLGYAVWGADATVGVGPVTLRGEYAWRRTDLSPAATYAFETPDLWLRKDGFYVEAEAPVATDLAGVVRYDALRRTGVPLPGAAKGLSQDSVIDRTTFGLVYTPATSLYAKLGYEYWRSNDFPAFHSIHLGFGGAF